MKQFVCAVVVLGTLSTACVIKPSEDPEVLATSRRAVEAMERAGTVVSRHCDPNEAFLNPTRWEGLPSDDHRETAARSLGILCEQRGFTRSMTVRSATDANRVLARYHGDPVTPLNDRFEVVP